MTHVLPKPFWAALGIAGGTLALAVLAGLGVVTFLKRSPAVPGSSAADDPNLAFSPWTWTCVGAGCQTTYEGACLRFGWTGRNLALGVDVSMEDRANVPPDAYPVLGCSIDDGPFAALRLAPGVSSIVVARGLADGRHRCRIYLRSIGFAAERWHAGRQVMLWRVTGLKLDPGARTVPVAGLRPRRALFFGDSILSGAFNHGAETDSRETWPEVVARRLDAEAARVGFEGQSYAMAASAAGGNVPPLFEPDDPAESTWDKRDSRHSRLAHGRFAPRHDFVFLTHGANDARAQLAARVEASVRGLLPRIRAASGPEAEVFVLVPVDGSHRAAITAALHAYRAASADRRCHLIDLGPEARVSIDDIVDGKHIRRSYDGLHPNAAMHARLGAMIAEQVRHTIAPETERFLQSPRSGTDVDPAARIPFSKK